jgi:hypothetical protein
MFRSLSDHLQGAHKFLVKVTQFKIFKTYELLEDDQNNDRNMFEHF